ncbi:di-heme-cytochrome C peroxidase [Rhodobium gokarnense]|uniref:Mono/diheme cytochrome c family protein n=1 Tax=Rhodobium gokarnense TaxID=364296 RepID=A0ABT3H8L8_9HYPH|nr:di-heme-cytochrome C peroxidase [Rhodobium gokarnense]MCW2306709.1 mono/diheme cytochrome c family protein [Rhodobium gokarnense]
MKHRLGLLIVAAVLTAPTTFATAQGEVVKQLQGWDANLRTLFYHTPQGSHMMQADLFAALEQPGGGGRFADSNYLAQFGFLPPDGPSTLNPNGYPIGFAIEERANQVGLTCAACHTAEVEVNGERIRIDGAPAHLDFDSFYQALATTVRLNAVSDALFERFAANFGAAEKDKQALRTRLRSASLKLTGGSVLRRPALASGYGRVDALTQIVNSLAVTDQSAPQNMYPVAAPTSYPPLWLTPDLEFVQWVPIAASPIARNGGQVLGVFGNSNMLPDAGADAFSSSILLKELTELEDWLKILKPPVWDEDLMGPIDADLRDKGAELFRENCAACHNMAPYRRTDPAVNYFKETFIEIGRVDYSVVGTDPAYVLSLLTRRVETNTTTAPLFNGASEVPAASFFAATVQANLGRAIAEAQLTQEEFFELNGKRFTKSDDGKPIPYSPQWPPTYLKASPLAGVWATGPYLHNGSVPTVYELLSPVEERRKVFWTGGRALDLRRLGYSSGDAPGRFRFDTSLPGNGNGGHLYPPGGLVHDERMAIVEYLKSQ